MSTSSRRPLPSPPTPPATPSRQRTHATPNRQLDDDEFSEPVPTSCFSCHGENIKRRETSSDNPNGNARRPYWKCLDRSCAQFLGFSDSIGNNPTNPECYCGTYSKMQAANRDKDSKVHYVCRLLQCIYYQEKRDEDGWVEVAQGGNMEIDELLANLRI